jgi:hypothetical protein
VAALLGCREPARGQKRERRLAPGDVEEPVAGIRTLVGEDRLVGETISEQRSKRFMSEQARRVKNKNIPEWAEGLYYNEGLISEVLVYHDEEAIYFEHKGKESGIVRFTFEMIEGLKKVRDEEAPTNSTR